MHVSTDPVVLIRFASLQYFLNADIVIFFILQPCTVDIHVVDSHVELAFDIVTDIQAVTSK